jgi:hypothetical protein
MTPHPDGAPVQQKGWFARNWMWLVPVGCLVPILCCGGFGAVTWFGVTKLIQNSDAYLQAVARVTSDAEVTEAFGGTVAPGSFLQGEVKDNNGESTADFQVPLTGPKGEGRLFVRGSSRGGQWTYTRLEVQTPAGKTIDLLSKGGGADLDRLPPPGNDGPEPDDPPEGE